VKFLATEAIESQAQLSPDGKSVAYTSDQSGTNEVYIRPFPTGPGVWKVSLDGGQEPEWSSDGKPLYYIRGLGSLGATLSSVSVEPDGRGGLRIGTSESLFEIAANIYRPPSDYFAYAVAPAGRFLVNAIPDPEPITINVVTNVQKLIRDKEPSRQ
jgi:hypothetical protein